MEQAEVCAVSPGQQQWGRRTYLCSFFGTSVQGYPLPISASHGDVLVKSSWPFRKHCWREHWHIDLPLNGRLSHASRSHRQVRIWHFVMNGLQVSRRVECPGFLVLKIKMIQSRNNSGFFNLYLISGDYHFHHTLKIISILIKNKKCVEALFRHFPVF